MLDDVKKRLESFGYACTDADDWPLGFIVSKVENQIKSDCNIAAIPAELHQTAVDMAVGEFFLGKKGSADGLPGFDLEMAEKSVQEGDTTVTFDVDNNKTPEQRLDALITRLLTPKVSFAAYRRIKW